MKALLLAIVGFLVVTASRIFAAVVSGAIRENFDVIVKRAFRLAALGFDRDDRADQALEWYVTYVRDSRHRQNTAMLLFIPQFFRHCRSSVSRLATRISSGDIQIPILYHLFLAIYVPISQSLIYIRSDEVPTVPLIVSSLAVIPAYLRFRSAGAIIKPVLTVGLGLIPIATGVSDMLIGAPHVGFGIALLPMNSLALLISWAYYQQNRRNSTQWTPHH